MEIKNVEHLKKFKEMKEIKEIIDEIEEIDNYIGNLNINKARDFLNKLSIKYAEDKIEYNALHPHMAKTLKENLNNAKQFLFFKAKKIIVKKASGFFENEK